jgi:hypothetical protein
VTVATTPGSPDFVPPAERIATFHKDGTLWLEKPMYIQFQHGLRAVGKMAAEKLQVKRRSVAGQDRCGFYQLELAHTLQKNGFQVYITLGCRSTMTIRRREYAQATAQALQLAHR